MNENQMEMEVLTFGAINTLKTIDAITFTEIARAPAGTIIWTCCTNTFCLAQNQCNTVCQQFIIVNGQKPATGIEIL